MNQGRIWCVVNPTVGLPLFLGSVAITSLVVHTAVLSRQSYYQQFYNGTSHTRAAMNEDGTPAAAPSAAAAKSDTAFSITVSPVVAQPGQTATSFVVTVSPNTVTTASADAPADASAVIAAR